MDLLIDYDVLNKPGILVYFVDVSIMTGNGAIQVLPVDDTDESKMSMTLSVGGLITNGSVTVNYTLNGTDYDHVYIMSNAIQLHFSICNILFICCSVIFMKQL